MRPARKVVQFLSEGHRLLASSPRTPSEIARAVKAPRPRVSEWRAGRSKPPATMRAAIEKALGIPRGSWDQPAREGTSPTAKPGEEISDETISVLGMAGLEDLARTLATLGPTLPPRERLLALSQQAKITAQHERLRQSQADARAEYFESGEFRADVELLGDAFPAEAEEFAARLQRIGVALPTFAPTPARTTSVTVAELVDELRLASQLRAKGEPRLASAHMRGLAFDADRIAAQLLRQPKRLAEVLDLLDSVDGARLRGALERAMAIRDVADLDAAVRAKVAELVRQLGHIDVAEQLGATDVR